MNTVTVNATEFSRGLSEFLNKVQYTGQTFDIERGKRVIARVSPVSSPALSAGFPISQLDDLLARSALSDDERALMAKDLRTLRSRLVVKADPWGL